jgi:hypothetical protein
MPWLDEFVTVTIALSLFVVDLSLRRGARSMCEALFHEA